MASTSPLLALVEDLGPSLTSTEANVRASAITQLVAGIKRDPVNDKEVSVVMGFLLDRIGDMACVKQCSEGVLHLFENCRLDDATIRHCVKRLLSEIFLQSEAVAVRINVLTVLQQVLNRHIDAIKPLDQEFVGGFLQHIDGEKDPRCLMMVFDMVPRVCENFDISAVADDYFDVTACYFPITFKPPKNDPYGVTSSGLKNGLLDSMTASPLFAEQCIDVFMDKATSTINESKVDSYNGMSRASQVFEYDCWRKWLEPLYANIRSDVFQSTSTDVHRAACAALVSVCKAVSVEDNQHRAKDLATLLKPMLADAKRYLSGSEPTVLATQTQMVVAACGGGEIAASMAMDELVDACIEQYDKQTDNEERKGAILATLVGMSQACAATSSTAALLKHEESLRQLFVACAGSSDERTAVAGVQGLTAIADALPSEDSRLVELGKQWISVCKRLASSTSSSDTASLAVAAGRLAVPLGDKVPPQTIISDIIGPIFAAQGLDQTTLLKAVANIVRSAPVATKFFETTVPLLTAPAVDSEQVGAAQAAAAACHHISQNWKCTLEVARDGFFRPLLGSLANIVQSSSQGMSADCALDHDSVLEATLRATAGFTSGLSSSSQAALIEELMHIAVGRGIVHSSGIEAMNFLHQPYSAAAHIVRLVTAALASCDNDVVTGLTTLAQLKDDFSGAIQKICASPESELGRVEAVPVCQAAAVLISKAPGPWTASLLAAVHSSMEAKVTPQVLTGVAWIIKALWMRGAVKECSNVVETIFTCLAEGSASNSQGAADAIGVIVHDYEQLGQKEGSLPLLQRRGLARLYKQRFFQTYLDRLIQYFSQAGADHKNNVTLALSHLLKSVPQQVLTDSMAQVLGVVLQSLHSDSETVLTPTLSVLETLLRESPDRMVEHVESIIDQLLRLSGHSRMAVRVAALHCLTTVAGLPSQAVVPHVRTVTRRLLDRLDDKKRLVRKAAVDCRATWFLVSS